MEHLRENVFAPTLDSCLNIASPIAVLEIAIDGQGWNEGKGIGDGDAIAGYACSTPIGAEADIRTADEEVGVGAFRVVVVY